MAGRPNKYKECVQPRFSEIKEWLQLGATDKEIAENLGVNHKVFCKYKKEYDELNELIKNGRKKPVQAIKAALYKKAIGFKYQEVTVVDSEKQGITTTTYTRYSLPDPTAAMMLLKHWDKKDNGEAKWTSDPASLELKKEELKLKEKSINENLW